MTIMQHCIVASVSYSMGTLFSATFGWLCFCLVLNIYVLQKLKMSPTTYSGMRIFLLIILLFVVWQTLRCLPWLQSLQVRLFRHFFSCRLLCTLSANRSSHFCIMLIKMRQSLNKNILDLSIYLSKFCMYHFE